MFEHKRARMLPMREFVHRQARFAAISIGIISVALAIGTLGYHALGDLAWIHALLNATMILTGMGPVDRMETTAGKLFAAGYALICGVVFLTTVGVLFAPAIHRFFHHMHLEFGDEGDDRR